jgi:hypothetical protein
LASKRSFKGTPVMKSLTMVGNPSKATTSWTVTMPGCRSCAAARASRWKRSRSASAVNRPVCGILSATMRSNSVSRAFQTAPKAPRPTRSRSRNLPKGRDGLVVAVWRASRTRKEPPQPGQSTSSGWSSASEMGL